MKRTEIVAKTEELVTPIIEENHFELVDVEYVREGANWYMQIKKVVSTLMTVF